MGIPWEHVYTLNIFPAHLELYHFIRVNLTLLYQSMTSHNNKELPLSMVPMLTFGNTRLADIDRHLSAIEGMNQLGKGATLVDIHL